MGEKFLDWLGFFNGADNRTRTCTPSRREPMGDVTLGKVLILPNRESLHISLSFFRLVC